jgi:hypothetical protein
VESKLGPLSTSATKWPIVPAPGDYDDAEFVGMKIGRGNRSIRRKPAPAPLCPPQIPLDQTRVWIESQLLSIHIVSCAVLFTLVLWPHSINQLVRWQYRVQVWQLNVIFDVHVEQEHLLTNQFLYGLLSLKKRDVLRNRSEQEEYERP